MSVGSLKQVELTHEVQELSEVPFLNIGQELQSKRNLVRYYKLIQKIMTDYTLATVAEGKIMPLPSSSYVNLLVDDPEMDFYRPKFITFPGSGAKVNRFGSDLPQLLHEIAYSFVPVIKRIRNELDIDGDGGEVQAKQFKLGVDVKIPVDPRTPDDFIQALATALRCSTPELAKRKVGAQDVMAYSVDLPYFV